MGTLTAFFGFPVGSVNTVKINFDLILVSGSAAASPGILLKFQVLEPHLDLLNQKLQGWVPVMHFFFFSVLPVYCYQPISLHPHACMLSHVIPKTAAHQAPLSMDFSRQEYWSGLPFPSPYFRYLIVTYGNHYHNGQYRRTLIPCFRLGWAEWGIFQASSKKTYYPFWLLAAFCDHEVIRAGSLGPRSYT